MKQTTEIAAASSRLLSPVVVRAAISPAADEQPAKDAVEDLLRLGMARGARTVRTLMWRCSRWLTQHHRNDLIYRKALTESDTAKMSLILQEFKVGQSVADYLLVSNSLHAVEIKSDVDGLRRLAAQLADYRRVAPLVSLFGSQRLVERVSDMAEHETVGLSWLDPEGAVRSLREPVHTTDGLDSATMMRSLRRVEYLSITEVLAGPVPAMPNTKIFGYAMAIAQGLDPLEYHREMVRVLGMRRPNASHWALSRVPAPLRPAVLKLNPTKDELARLQRWLNREVESVLT